MKKTYSLLKQYVWVLLWLIICFAVTAGIFSLMYWTMSTSISEIKFDQPQTLRSILAIVLLALSSLAISLFIIRFPLLPVMNWLSDKKEKYKTT